MAEKFVLGVSGSCCSGKNLAVTCLEDRNLQVIDVDRLGHKALETAAEQVVDAFGSQILDSETSQKIRINRKKLGNIVFSNPRELKKLEDIVHPVMIKMVQKQIAESSRDVVINAALLRRMKLDRMCDTVFFITACFPVRIKRAVRRDNLTVFQVLKRFARQRDIKPVLSEPYTEGKTPENSSQISSKDVDILTIGNNGSRENLCRRINDLFEKCRKEWNSKKSFGS